MIGFEIWDTKTGNLLGDYETEAEALADAATAVKAHGEEFVDSLVLIRVGPRGGLSRIAAGATLVSRARLAQEAGRRRIPA